jgi:arylsulfatase A-like enzyme
MSTSSANVVIVTVDCLRRDRVSAYGYPRATTPFLDSLLPTSLHALSAHSVSSWTCPSVCSVLTGRYPHHHGGGIIPGEPKNLSKRNLPTRLPAAIPTLAERLGARGYATAAFGAVWNAHLPVAGRFEHMVMLERSADRLIARALKWVERQERPFLLWLHLGDTHEPLDVPADLRETFGPVPRLRKARTWAFMRATDDVASSEFERYRAARTALYDVAVRAVDRELERFMRELGSLGLRDRTVVAITSDHGEELWEHRAEELAFHDPRGFFGTGHGHHLFQVHLLVPLILTGPDVPSIDLDRNVSLVDLAPTVLDLVGIEGDSSADGHSLLDTSATDRPVVAGWIAYGFEKHAVIDADVKLLSAPGDGIERVYRLGRDRREIGTIDDGAIAARLRTLLPTDAVVTGEQVTATDEIEEHLRHLGYLE